PDPVRAVAAYQAVLDIDPFEQVAVNNIAMAYLTMERFEDAESVLRRSLTHGPTRTMYLNFSDALSGKGKWAANDSVAELATRELDPPGDTPLTILLNGAERSRDVARADSLLRQHHDPVANRVDRDNRRYSNVILHLAIGQHATALAVLDSEAQERAEGGEPGSALDDAVTRAWDQAIFGGDPVAARRTLELLLRKYPIERIPPTDRPYLTLVDIYAHLGDIDGVRRTRRAFEAAFPEAERPPESPATWDAAEALARGDRVAEIAALRRARQLAWCAHCGLYEEGEAWDRLGQADSARVTLERAVSTIAYRDEYNDAAFYAPALQRLGELYEAKGDRAKAQEYYQRFIDRWRKADPALQPRVAAAKERLTALGSDQARNP
ncbi:MAG: tetratricopeptide repeat protein, partial [Gemmatimonadetes bacterium]|nr:tetratricopeptide repeat protein [Gemmatimonadota bacterium]